MQKFNKTIYWRTLLECMVFDLFTSLYSTSPAPHSEETTLFFPTSLIWQLLVTLQIFFFCKITEQMIILLYLMHVLCMHFAKV